MHIRQLAAIMFTDLVGYTLSMQKSEEAAIKKRDRSRKILEESLAKHEGRLLQYYGDGALSIFTSGVNAVKSAIEIQTLSLEEPKIHLRIGIHTGDVMFDENGVYGDSVNVSSRIESLSTPGSIFISEKLFDEVKNNDAISAKSLGFFELKNVQQPMQVYAITNPGIVVPSREALRGKTKTALNGIAVLPFASLSSDPENEFFCDGITEELINVLSKVSGLQVISRTSAFAFKGRQEDIRDIAAKLNVQKIIEGSVRKSGNRMRITVQLINSADGYHFWSETYDRNPDDIFEVQDEIARAIANKLRENLSTEQHQSRLTSAPTENLEAYKKYIRGMQLWERAEPEQRKIAMQLLQEVVEMDPKFVSVHALLASGYVFLGQTGQMSAQEAFRLAHKHVDLALQTNPGHSFAMVVSAGLKMADWKWNEGFELLQRALEINPNDSAAHMMAAEFYVLFMDPEKELKHATLAFQLDPLSANTMGETARHYLTAGKPKEGLDLAEEALLLDPHNLVSRSIRAYATAMTGNPKEGLKQMLEIYAVTGDHPLVLLGIGYMYARLNEKEKVQEIIAKIEAMMEQMPEANLDFAVAMLCADIGEMEKFRRSYDRAIERKAQWMVQFYGSEMSRSIWYDEHVIATRKKLGLPVYERQVKSQ